MPRKCLILLIEVLDEVTLTMERDIAFSPLRVAFGGITEVTPGPDERVSASYTLSTFSARVGLAPGLDFRAMGRLQRLKASTKALTTLVFAQRSNPWSTVFRESKCSGRSRTPWRKLEAPVLKQAEGNISCRYWSAITMSIRLSRC